MNSSSPNPSLPAWIFIATDLALISVGLLIAVWAPHPLAPQTIFWIVVCVTLGAIVGLVPLVASYERRKNAALDERQQALEALARTVAESAEQIGIAATGLHQIAELASKNLRLAEQLPHKLQEKIAEFQAQLGNTTESDREELERELLALRTSESERLETISQRIAKSAADWSKLEAATHQHLAAANDAVARLDAKLAATAATLVERIVGDLAGQLARLSATAPASSPPAASPALPVAETAAASPGSPPGESKAAAPALAASLSSAPDEPQPVPAKSIPEVTPVAPSTAEPFSGQTASPSNGHASPSDTAKPPHKRAVKSSKSAPGDADADTDAGLGLELDHAPDALDARNRGHPARRAPVKADETPAVPVPLPLPAPARVAAVASGSAPAPVSASAPAPPDLAAERAPTSDGATRLLVTAYIGIGNRLFIRGEGPGLSWEKGVPLQFVSIGKWRWETNAASAPVQFKLYKNDELECAALGERLLEPGHQQEIAAAF